MADWGKILTRGKVDDRRGLAPVVGGVSIAGVALLVFFNLLAGNPPEAVLEDLQNIPIEQQVTGDIEFEGRDEYEEFASAVLGSNNEMWSVVFNEIGKTYNEPQLVLFRTATPSSCGYATSGVGPHYCALDGTIYLDETFFSELIERFGARGGDVAEAYVISHEVGHHVQNILGTFNKVSSNPTNENQIALELQADCFAGLWANSIKNLDVLEKDEIIEAMDAAAAVGDDRIQEKVTGYVNPESWTHGSSEDRVRWFTRGYDNGNLSACNTFE